MSFATDGKTEDLGPAYRRGPISVAQLLEREGFQPATRSRATRRALTGVAAGAVLALGAVVGSLLLNHGTDNSNGDTLASGNQSGGDIVLAEGGQSNTSVVTPATAAQVSTPAGSVASNANAVPNSSTGRITIASRSTTSTHRVTTTTPASGTAGSGGTVTTTSTAATSSAPATTSSTPSTQSAPTTSASSSTTSNSAAGSSSTATSSNNGGLVGDVAGTVSGTLSSVTTPLFNWFNG